VNDSSKKLIAYVDDEPANLTLVQKALKNSYEVRCFSNGDEFMASDYNEPDLILLDVQMPGLNGYEICQKLRQELIKKPILFLSCFSTVEDRLKGYESGGDDYLTKPFDVMELRDKIESNLDRVHELESVKQQLTDSNKFAFQLMANAGELGSILRYISESYLANNVEPLSQSLLSVLQEYDLRASVRLQVAGKDYVESSSESISNLAHELLFAYPNAKKIATFQNRCLLSTNEVSILIKNLPDDEEKVGRLRDHLAAILDATVHQLRYLTAQEHQRQAHSAFMGSLRSRTDSLIDNVDTMNAAAKNNIRNTNNAIKNSLIDLEVTADLDEHALDSIRDISNTFEENMSDLVDQMDEMEDQINSLIEVIRSNK